MTPKEIGENPDAVSDEELSKTDHSTLYAARSYANQSGQNKIAPYEHRAFAREAVKDNPLMAIPIAAGIPSYQVYKAIMGARSKASWSQVGQGLLGIGEGLRDSLSSK
jgi:hypothetical protein